MYRQRPRPPSTGHPIWRQPFLCKIGQTTSTIIDAAVIDYLQAQGLQVEGLTDS